SHFREAAALYKDHLRRPREAAVCLAEGGLFAEAIAIYEHESLFLEAGDLYAKLGQADQAKAAYQLEVERRLKQGDRLGSAQLLEQKIDEPEAALKVLNEGWPSSAQAGQCLAAEFELLARKSWHAKTVERLESLRVEATSANMVSTLARVLANQSAQYPDRVIRHSAADIVRVKASERLETAASAAELSALTDTLNTLAPEDKLLARDSSRFTSNAKERFRRNKRLPARLGKAGHPILVRTFQLPKGVRWHTVKSCGGFYFAAGNGSNPQSGEKALVLIRGDWEGMQQPLGFPPPILMPPPLLLELDEETSRPGRLIMTSGPSRPLIRIGERAFPAADRFPGLVPAGTPDWLPNDVVKVCTRGARAWVLRDWGGGIVECRTIAGDILSSFTVSEAFAGNPGTIFSSSLLVQRDFLWLAGKQRLLLYRQGQIVAQWEAETEIQSLVASAPNLPVCVAVRLAKGVSLHWVDALKERTETLCAELLQPLAAFTANGTLVLMRGNEGRICEVSPRATKGISSFELLGQTPIEVVRADGPNRFGVFSADGKVQLFRVDE
ncbi:MAG TPA: hypothetical protein VLT36_06260, partial [Candidatus Dormibacteraeota bacterium]|nr:hypothetical protein [Candidatus Dormibacteraeota bacterium]